MTIHRTPGVYQGRSPAVAYGGLVYAVATARSSSSSVTEQTQLTLAALEKNLESGGSDKTRILQVTVYLRDLASKEEMDAVWCDWIGAAENWPQRACVGTDLAGDDLIEIVAVAAAT